MNTWSSIVQKGIPIDYAQRMDEQYGIISTFRDIYDILYSNKDIVVNSRDIPVEFHENEIGSNEKKGEKKFYRKRNVSRVKVKNFPTKPKNNGKESDISEKMKVIRSLIHHGN